MKVFFIGEKIEVILKNIYLDFLMYILGLFISMKFYGIRLTT